ncbi:unnamed protein product [Durusdinium trenchii]|uniref:Uncharacterized protein n=1 Tax=Durusdinium trenchii TaxID=1381693 RepID=A0ABP0SGL5_9DINO
MFKEEALAYLFTLETQKRYLGGPRLAQGLTGVARTVIRKKLAVDPPWLAHPRGAYDLIEHLEQSLGQPTLIQAAQHIQKFFYQLKRKRNETMTQWTSRHSEALWDASRALQRVNSEHGSGTTAGGSSKHTGKTYSDASWGRRSHGSSTAARRDDDSRTGDRDGGPFDENGRMRDDGEASEVPPDPDYEPEAYAAFMDEQTVIDSALEAIKEKKRTLQEARWRQQQVRSGRKFYAPPANKGGGKGHFRHGDRDQGPQKCLKCGGPHQTANCQVQRKPQANVTEEAEVAFQAQHDSLSCEQAQVSAEDLADLRREMMEPHSDSSFVKVKPSDSEQELERVKAELEQLKSENAQLTRQAERSKSRKEM